MRWLVGARGRGRASVELDVGGLAARLRNHLDPVSLFLWNQFLAPSRDVLNNATSSEADIRTTLLGELNRLIEGSSIYDQTRFLNITLSAETKALQQGNPTGTDLARLNRLLLMDAYPGLIAPLQNPVAQYLQDALNNGSKIQTSEKAG